MKRLKSGKYISTGYLYKGYEVRNHGYYPPDRCVYWEAIDVETGQADCHAKTKRGIKALIDEQNAVNQSAAIDATSGAR